MLPIAEPTSLGATLKVTKKGKTTDVTYGHIIKINHSASLRRQNGRYYVFDKCYCIKNDRKRFLEGGDSGSGVFLIDAENKTLKPIGIGFITGRTYSYVCKIKHVLDKFQLTICKDEFASNFFTKRKKKANKGCGVNNNNKETCLNNCL